MKRTPMALVAASALLLVPTACSSDDEEGNPATLTVFAAQGPGRNLQTNAFTKHLSEKFGITFQFETTTYDAAGASEKRQISLASGDYPDVYLLIPWVDQFSQAELLKLSKQGVAQPLNDLIAEHAPNIQKALNETPEYKAMATAPDGKIYGLPQWNDCFHCSYSAKLWINSTWLKKLGLSMPESTEDMRNVLRAFKTRDPNGNGKADEIPLTADTSDLLLPYFTNAFLYNPQASDVFSSTLAVSNGEVRLQAAQDAYRDALRYMASLYAEGLIDTGAFTQNRDALKSKGDNADAVIVGAATVQNPAILLSLGQKDGRDKQYDAVPPLTGPAGVGYASYNLPSIPGATFIITNKATEQERVNAIKMLDYIYTTQGHLLGEFGKEGTGWQKPGAGDVALNEIVKPLYQVIPVDPNAPEVNESWGAMAQYYSPRAFRDAQMQPTDIYSPAGFERRLFEATKLYEGKEAKDQVFPYWKLWISEELSSEVATLQTNIENYIAQSSAEFVTGKKNITDDGAWSAYRGGLEGLNLKRYLEIQQQAYDAL